MVFTKKQSSAGLKFSRESLRLIAAFRGVPSSGFERSLPPPKPFAQVLTKTVQSTSKLYSPTFQILQTHWNDWFRGTEFQSVIPERLDRWNALWLKTPDAIMRQKLQFKSEQLLKTLNALVPGKIESVRWVG